MSSSIGVDNSEWEQPCSWQRCQNVDPILCPMSLAQLGHRFARQQFGSISEDKAIPVWSIYPNGWGHFDSHLSTKKYPTRSTSSNLVPHFDEPEKTYHRRLKEKLVSHTPHASSSLYTPPCIRNLFPSPPPPMATPWMSDTYKPLDVSVIQGAHHSLPQKFIEWLPKFSNNNAICSK